MKSNIILEIRNLKKYFPVRGGLFSKTIGYIKAVDGVSFNLKKGETLGLVGESGCGKTTLGMSILRLVEPTGGDIIFKGKNISKIKGSELFKLYKEMQIIFQDPFSSLNPRMKVGEIIGEPLIRYKLVKKGKESIENVQQLLKKVGLNNSIVEKYPFELSGGQRQRVVIARSLALSPDLIICDEPSSALDVSIQAQILNLLEDLKKNLSLTYLFISHDLSVAKYISEQIAVMYLGKIVEIGESDNIIYRAKHPYTKALIASVPVLDPKIKKNDLPLKGEVFSSILIPPGCRFNSICPYAEKICFNCEPELKETEKEHFVACHFL